MSMFLQIRWLPWVAEPRPRPPSAAPGSRHRPGPACSAGWIGRRAGAAATGARGAPAAGPKCSAAASRRQFPDRRDQNLMTIKLILNKLK